MASGSPGRTRNATACEYCRTAKARCEPSEQPGVCTKCFGSRRECISRTKPRPRRTRKTALVKDREPATQVGGQSTATFSIDYDIPTRIQLENGFGTLRDLHNTAFERVLNEDGGIQGTPTSAQSSISTSSLENQSRSISDLWRKPQFNLASAEFLLASFDNMLEHLPFIILPIETSVPEMAATQPFVLLAILTVASGSKAVQTHTLYDEEFLKILGLKYVSGGERSLQLLQGLLIYCAWYPFHLTPKTSQLAHCMRMAADIVHELCLDETFLASEPWEQSVPDEEMDKIRAYLAYVSLVTTYIVVWKGERCLPTQMSPWIDTAIDILEHHANVESDQTLAASVRLSILFSDTSDAINERAKQTVRNSQLILVGLEQKYQQMRNNMLLTLPNIVDNEHITLQTMFLDIYLDAGSLLAFPVARTSLSARLTRFPPPISKMYSATKKIKAFLDYTSSLSDDSLLSLTVNDWTRLIVVLTLSFRLSFPVSSCPAFDSTWARSQIQLDTFLLKISAGSDAGDGGIISASRAVLGVLKSKYDNRLSSLSNESTAKKSTMAGCPVMTNGSFDSILAQYAPALTQMSESPVDSDSVPDMHPMFYSMWPTMGDASQDIDEAFWSQFGIN